MRSKLTKLIGASLLFLLLSPPLLQASWFEIVDANTINHPTKSYWFEPKCNITMTGWFNEDTVKDFQEKARELPAHEEGFRALCLDSEGGDLENALDLIEHLQGWITVVPAGAQCTSACAIAFMGGGAPGKPGAIGSRREGRYLHVNGQLGFHAPELDFEQTEPKRAYTDAEVAEAYRRMQKTVRRLLFYNYASALDKRERDRKEKLANLDEQQNLETFVSKLSAPSKEKKEELTRKFKEMQASEDDRFRLAAIRAGKRLTDDDFLAESLFFIFLTTPPDTLVHANPIDLALRWGVQLYGLPRLERMTELAMLAACDNAAAMLCAQAGSACPSRPSFFNFNADSTIPIVAQLKEERDFKHVDLRDEAFPNAHVERITIAPVSGNSQEQCRLSVYYKDGNFGGALAEIFPRRNSWRESINALTSSSRSMRKAIGRVISQLETDGPADRLVYLRPWMWLPANFNNISAQEELAQISSLASLEEERYKKQEYHRLEVCNATANAVYYAVGFKNKGDLVSQGWYRVPREGCVVPDAVPFSDKLYIYGGTFVRSASGPVFKALQGAPQAGQQVLCIEETSKDPFDWFVAKGAKACEGQAGNGEFKGSSVSFALVDKRPWGITRFTFTDGEKRELRFSRASTHRFPPGSLFPCLRPWPLQAELGQFECSEKPWEAPRQPSAAPLKAN